MDQRPDMDKGPSSGPRVEDDFIRPLSHARGVGRRRLPAALPFAIAGILVVSSVAFGATVVRSLVSPAATATPVIVGDDDPTDTPLITEAPSITPAPVTEPPATEPPATATPTAEPTAPPTEEVTQGPSEHAMTLIATRSGGKVKLEWTRYQGEDFAYYKVVRSSDPTVSWPLGDGDKLVAFISDIDQLSFTDCPPAGTTVYYEVFAVKSSDSGYETLADTNVVSVVMPAATPKPVPTCGIHLDAVVQANSVVLTWTKYTCDKFEMYVVGKSETNSHLDFPLPNEGTSPVQEIPNVNHLTWTDTDVQAGHTYYYRVMAWNSNEFCYGGTVLAKSNIVKVVIPNGVG